MITVRFFFDDRYSCNVEMEPVDTMIDVSKMKKDIEIEFDKNVVKIELEIQTH